MSKNQLLAPRSLVLTVLALSVLAFGLVAACSKNSAKAKPNFVFKDPPKPGILAKINGEEITEEMLIGDAKLRYMEILKREYDFKMERLQDLLEEKIIGAAAAKSGMSRQDYINKEIVKGDVKISDKDFKSFIEEKKIPESQVNPQLKERILTYMKEQQKQKAVDQFIAKHTKNAPAEVYFKKPRTAINVELGNAPLQGSSSAPVTIVEFSDFQCPFCSQGALTLAEVKKKYGSKLRVAFKHFPLSFHKDARPAAEASMCVNEQGSDKFWKFHDIAFKNQKSLDLASLEKYAKESGADVKKYKECFEAKKYADVVQKDMDYGEKIGVRSTPTFFINGELVSGAVPIDQFSEVIDHALDEK